MSLASINFSIKKVAQTGSHFQRAPQLGANNYIIA
jgi:hypothetical protein